MVFYVFVCVDKGFISLTSVNNSTKRVRAGESLSLRVVMDAYPKPHTFSWSYSGVKLTNTTDHVITSRSHGNRYDFITTNNSCFSYVAIARDAAYHIGTISVI